MVIIVTPINHNSIKITPNSKIMDTPSVTINLTNTEDTPSTSRDSTIKCSISSVILNRHNTATLSIDKPINSQAAKLTSIIFVLS